MDRNGGCVHRNTQANQWRQRHAAGDVLLVRYADDSVMGFQYEGEARCFLAAMRKRLANFKLELYSDKTRLIRFGRYAAQQCRERKAQKPETFDFLGPTHCRAQTSGNFLLVRVTSKKRTRASPAAIRDALMRRRHQPVPVIGKWLNRVIGGYLNYHAVPTASARYRPYLSDALGNLVLAGVAVLAGVKSISVGFDEEPGRFILVHRARCTLPPHASAPRMGH